MRAVRYSAATHRGKVRQINEDSLLSLPDQGVWTVSDGMGGHHGGDFASQTVTEALAMLPLELSADRIVFSVRQAMSAAHHAIQRERERRGVEMIGATVVVLTLVEGRYSILWSGDSRVYRLRAGELEMLTSDHSAVGEFVRAGKMTWDEADQQPYANQIFRAIGVGDEVELDVVEGWIQPGDRFLLCSDGLTKYADSHMLRAVLSTSGIEKVSDKLLQIALDGGGDDNVSLIVVEVP